MNNLTRRTNCRLCGGDNFDHVLPIRASAIGDAFVSADRLHEKQGVYPLDLYLCLTCGHLQNLDIVNPEIMFRDYTYRTSVSLGLVEHFREYAADTVKRLGIARGSLVVEIGSNDGTLLKAFKELGMKVVGVDPARNIAHEATASGVPTLPEYFSSAIAKNILSEHGQARLICANNVFAHIDEMSDVVKGIHKLLASDGVFVFEVSYVPDIIDSFVFDTVYHEHVSHHAIIPLERFFQTQRMSLFDVIRVRTKGGSIRGFAQKISEGLRLRTSAIDELIRTETTRGITRPEIYRNFFSEIEKRKRALDELLDDCERRGLLVAGFGASTTTTTLVYHFELGKRLSFIVDDNPKKHYQYSPGNHIPVLPSEELYVRRPDYVVILAWIYADAIVRRHKRFIEEGGKFVIPLPDLKIV